MHICLPARRLSACRQGPAAGRFDLGGGGGSVHQDWQLRCDRRRSIAQLCWCMCVYVRLGCTLDAHSWVGTLWSSPATNCMSATRARTTHPAHVLLLPATDPLHPPQQHIATFLGPIALCSTAVGPFMPLSSGHARTASARYLGWCILAFAGNCGRSLGRQAGVGATGRGSTPVLCMRQQ